MSGLCNLSRLLRLRITPRRAGLLMILIGAVTLLGLIGCGTPRERYHTLTIFFDGVPDPDAPAKGRTTNTGPKAVVAARIVSQHKPFLDNRCAECHHAANGDVQDFSLAYEACLKCHAKVPAERTLMHGPVARAQCKWCHAPHQSTEPFLLKDTPIDVCTQCHDKQLLSNDPPEHSDGATSCLLCHFGHGGPAHFFLKPAATQPAATAPSTAPATEPAPLRLPGTETLP